MSNSVFPYQIHGLRLQNIVKTPEFGTIVQSAPNGAETRVQQRQNPVWHWSLIYDYLYDNFISPNNTLPYAPYTDFRTLLGFFMARHGRYDDFLFTDPDDNSVGPAMLGGSPNAQAQLPLVNDGAGTYYSPVQRNIGGLFWEDIGALNGSIAVYANGVSTSAYSLLGPGLAIPGYSYAGMYLKWSAMPTAPITAQFNYYFRVRFESDTQDFEKFLYGLWTVGGANAQSGSGVLKLMSARTSNV